MSAEIGVSTMPDTKIDIAEVRGLLEKATSGPWEQSARNEILGAVDGDGEDVVIGALGVSSGFRSHVYTACKREAPANAALIVKAVNALPTLLDQLEQSQREVERLAKNIGTMADDLAWTNTARINAEARIAELTAEVERVNGLLNLPEVADFVEGVRREVPHQRERWGASHDAGKAPLDWFWLIGFLAQKAAAAHMAGNAEKARHHTISTSAALANWHAAISGASNIMRPGIDPVGRDDCPACGGSGALDSAGFAMDPCPRCAATQALQEGE